jgi:transposase
LGFQSFYLYSATSDTGEDYTLIADVVNKECMQIFLDEFSKTLSSEIILVMDNAPWHKSLKAPSNIEIVYLPPYSPELNPVERLWKYLKDHILRNKVYESLEDLEATVSLFIRAIKKEEIASICSCDYIRL